MNSIGGQCGIGIPLPNNQIGGENFIRHIGNDKLIFDFKEGSGTTVRDKSHCGNDGVFPRDAIAGISEYPPAQSDTYVKATTKYSTGYWAYFATDPAKTLTGNDTNGSWISDAGGNTDQRFHIDLGSTKIVKRIYCENYHNSGGSLTIGVQNFTFWGSNTGAGSFDDLVYGNDEGWTELTVSQNTFDQHVGADQADPKYITVQNLTAYRYYAFKFVDNYGDGSYMGVRRIELQLETAWKGTTAAPTRRRNSLYFDGGDCVKLAQDFLAKADFVNGGSFVVVHKTPTTSGTQDLIDIEGAWFLHFISTGKIKFDIDGGSTAPSSISSSRYDDNVYHCTIGTWDKETSATVKNIIDCVVDGVSTQDLFNNSLNRESAIGSNYAHNNKWYIGSIKMVHILNKCLSGIECQQEYLTNKFRGNN